MEVGKVSNRFNSIFTVLLAICIFYFLRFLYLEQLGTVLAPFLLFVLLDKPLTCLHEFAHSITANKYGYKTEIILNRKRIKKEFNKKSKGICHFINSNDKFEYSTLIKIYLAPFVVFVLINILLVLSFIFISITLVKIIIAIFIVLFMFKLEGCKGDIAAVIDLMKNKNDISSIYYSNNRFHIKLN